MGFNDATREMILEAWFPGRNPSDVLERMEFEVDVSRARELEPPTERELRILREEVDPQRLILG
jgi:glutaconate CoA-transferase subunit B